ncbi:hypothetical protein [Tuwongella immobilis]|uniref:Marine sediment metagenome DNA, contig: S03H2_L01983 n=1 Tax=Tuwongella immobilis TaxID=692036 RepID=A0A6C2YR47_9BACT
MNRIFLIERMRWLILLLGLVGIPGQATSAERTQTRILQSFESPEETARWASRLEGGTLTRSADSGVTHGSSCGRWVVPKGTEYGIINWDLSMIRDWSEFDFLAIDCVTEDDHPYAIVLELFDAASRNYATRCTFESITTRPGRQTLLYPIGKARRNAAEGREWDELVPADKIDLKNLTRVKCFVVPRKDRDAIFFIDQIRLMQADAVRPPMRLNLPKGALAWNFGPVGAKVPGFQTISPQRGADNAGASITGSDNLHADGDGRPDPLVGSTIWADEGETLTVRLPAPPGRYRYRLLAGYHFRVDPGDLEFQLHLQNNPIIAEVNTPTEYHSERRLFRFLRTPYTENIETLWATTWDRMIPTHRGEITVDSNGVTIRMKNVLLAALILLPMNANDQEFDAQLRAARLNVFRQQVRPLPAADALPNGETWQLWQADPTTEITPRTRPSLPNGSPKSTPSITLTGVPKQTMTACLAMVTSRSMATVGMTPMPLTAKTGESIPAPRTLVHNFRWAGDTLTEMGLIPSTSWPTQTGVTLPIWLELPIPANAKPGIYRGEIRLTLADESRTIPIELEVLPVTLIDSVPASLGLYGTPRKLKPLQELQRRELWTRELRTMQSLGLTATILPPPIVTRLDRQGRPMMHFQSDLPNLMRELGFGKHPQQHQMGNTLGMGRAVGRWLKGLNGDGRAIDRQPGIELLLPGFESAYADGLRQYRGWMQSLGMPVAVEIVDEPREVPNPWNRNLADTLTYARYVRQAGLTGFVTPMADSNGGKDYTPLVDAVEIVSVHAWEPSRRLIESTRARSKSLWIYNTGRDRLTWGVYPWRVGATGRWEWHWQWTEDTGYGGYPGREWFNPFTGSHGVTSMAPLDSPDGVILTSSLFAIREGIDDWRCLVTLEQQIRQAKSAGSKQDAVAAAEAFLAAIRQEVPLIPPTKGLSDAADGALIGSGVGGPLARKPAQWRGELWRHLIATRP